MYHFQKDMHFAALQSGTYLCLVSLSPFAILIFLSGVKGLIDVFTHSFIHPTNAY